MTATDLPSVTISLPSMNTNGDGGRTVVWLRGEHDVSTAAEVEAALTRAIVLDEVSDLVVDLSGVEFMDASTLGVIVRTRNYLQPLSRSLIVRAPTTRARRLFEVCKLDALIDGGADYAANASRV